MIDVIKIYSLYVSLYIQYYLKVNDFDNKVEKKI